MNSEFGGLGRDQFGIRGSRSLPPPRTGWASLKDLNRYQWFVFVVCCLAWDLDCLDQQLFVLARDPALSARRDAWATVPDRLDGNGATVMVEVAALRQHIDRAVTIAADGGRHL